MHDTPVHPPWSSRGDLALGIGCSYTIIPGVTDLTPPREPWDLLATRPSAPGSRAYSLERPDLVEDGSVDHHFRNSPTFSTTQAPTFGRGDEDGFPALSPAPATPAERGSPGRRRQRTAIPSTGLFAKDLPFEHTAVGKGHHAHKRNRGHGHSRDHDHDTPHPHAPPTTPKTVTLALDDPDGKAKHSRRTAAVRALQHVVEWDISMLMRRRAMLAYGLMDVSRSPLRLCIILMSF